MAYANKGGMVHESKGQHIGKAPYPYILYTLQHGGLTKMYHEFTNFYKKFMAMASFSCLFLAPPTWLGNETSTIHQYAL